MIEAYIGLGSNLGESEHTIRQALQTLNQKPGVTVEKVAGLYRTAPVGYTDQAWFVNTAAKLNTTLKPLELLATLQEVELQYGRVREQRWGPRTLDLDLLLYDNKVINLPELIVPHPRMLERAFVMVPLAELNPDLLVNNKNVNEIAKILKNAQEIVGTRQKVW